MEDVSEIIRRRKRGSLFTCCVIVLIIIAGSWQAASQSSRLNMGFLAASCTILAIFFLIFVVNALNYPAPKPYYRSFNKVLYIYMAKIGVVFAALRTITDLK